LSTNLQGLPTDTLARWRLVNLAGSVLAEGEEVALNQSAVLRGYSVRVTAQYGRGRSTGSPFKCVRLSLFARGKLPVLQRVFPVRM